MLMSLFFLFQLVSEISDGGSANVAECEKASENANNDFTNANHAYQNCAGNIINVTTTYTLNLSNQIASCLGSSS